MAMLKPYLLFMLSLLGAFATRSAGTELPALETLLNAFQNRASETRYLNYHFEGTGNIPAFSYEDKDPETFQKSGRKLPPEKLSFDWVAGAQLDIEAKRGVYEDKYRVLNLAEKIFMPVHERTYLEGLLGDTEFLLTPQKKSLGVPPVPDVKFSINESRSYRGAGMCYVPEAISAAFGHISREDGTMIPISDLNWASAFNASVLPTEMPGVVMLQFADERNPDNIEAFRLFCESSVPYRMLRIEHGFAEWPIQRVSLDYDGYTMNITSIDVELFDVFVNRKIFAGKATAIHFDASAWVPKFDSRAKPKEGDWVREFTTGRVYRFESSRRWSTNRTLTMSMSVVGLLVAVFLFRRSSGSARATIRK